MLSAILDWWRLRSFRWETRVSTEMLLMLTPQDMRPHLLAAFGQVEDTVGAHFASKRTPQSAACAIVSQTLARSFAQLPPLGRAAIVNSMRRDDGTRPFNELALVAQQFRWLEVVAGKWLAAGQVTEAELKALVDVPVQALTVDHRQGPLTDLLLSRLAEMMAGPSQSTTA